MTLRIRAGGFIRWAYPVNSASTWNDGQLVQVDPLLETVSVGTGVTNLLTAVAIEAQPGTALPTGPGFGGSVQGSGFSTNITRGSGKVSLLLDTAVIETDQFASGIQFNAGQLVYSTNAGLFTVSNANNKPYGRVMARVGELVSGADATGPGLPTGPWLTILLSPPLV